jgi:hypothetical protein
MISTFFPGNPVTTKNQLSWVTGFSTKTIGSKVGYRLLTSLNHNHWYITLKGRVSWKRDHKDIYRRELATGSYGGPVSHPRCA